jgi:hypothetical protein
MSQLNLTRSMSPFHFKSALALALTLHLSAIHADATEVLVYSVTRSGTSVGYEARATVAPTTALTGLAPSTVVVSIKSYLILDRGVRLDSDGVWRGNMAQVYYYTQPFGTGTLRAYEVVPGSYRVSSSTAVAASQPLPYNAVLNEGPPSASGNPKGYEQLSLMWAFDGIGSDTFPYPESFSKAAVGIVDSRKIESTEGGLSESLYDVQSLHGVAPLGYRFPVPAGSAPLLMFGIPTVMNGNWQTTSTYDWDRSAENPAPPYLRSVAHIHQHGTQKATLNTKLTVEANPVTLVRTNGADNMPNTPDDVFTQIRDGSIQRGLLAVTYTLDALGYIDLTQ